MHILGQISLQIMSGNHSTIRASGVVRRWRSLLLLLFSITATAAFVPPSCHHSMPRSCPVLFRHTHSSTTQNYKTNHQQRLLQVRLNAKDDNEEQDHLQDTPKERLESKPTSPLNSIVQRFLSPRLDDPFLPLVDASMAQIVAPFIQICWLRVFQYSDPSWLRPMFTSSVNVLGATQRGALLAPALIHGAALASCWLVGALAAKAYEQEAIAPREVSAIDTNKSVDYTNVLVRVCQAGAFATGVLLLSTQFDLFLDFHGTIVQLGDSPESDVRILLALSEVIQDIVFEAITLITWRLYLATNQTPLPPKL